MSKRKLNKKPTKKRIIIAVAALLVLGSISSNGNEDKQNNSPASDVNNVTEVNVSITEKATEGFLSAVQAMPTIISM